MKYPRINAPQPKQDGKWSVRICRSATDEEVITYPSKSQALAGAEALRVAQRLLTPADKQPVIANVRGPNKDGGRYVLRWTEDGVSRATTGTRPEMAKIRDELMGGATTARQLLRKRGRFGSAAFFRLSLMDALDANLDAVNRRDFDGIKASRGRIEALKEAQQTLTISEGYGEVEAQLEGVMDYLEVHGHLTRREGAKELQPATPGLAEALGSSTGPFAADGGHDPSLPAQGRSTRGKSN